MRRYPLFLNALVNAEAFLIPSEFVHQEDEKSGYFNIIPL
jgi:hypothetical protein